MLICLGVFLGPEQPSTSWWWGLHSMGEEEGEEGQPAWRAACVPWGLEWGTVCESVQSL